MKRIILVGAACAAALLMACGEEGGEEKKAPLASIALAADAEFKVGTTVQLRVIGTREDGTQDELTEGITFASSDPEIATVDPLTGLATVLVGGNTTFTAQVEAFNASLDTRTSCNYPHFAPDIVYDRTMPALSWPARWPDGTEFELKLEDVYCDRDWKNIDTMIVVISAAWCVPCREYARDLALIAEELEAEHRTKILYVIGQDTDGVPSDTEYGYEYMDRIISNGRIPGIIVGDSETRPEPAFVQKSSHLLAWPSVFVIRTRDMKIIASGNRSNQHLPLESIADNPEKDWGSPGVPVFRNKCDTGDQEDSEPNDDPGEAALISAGTFEGGICKDAPDLYRVELAGAWEFKIEFDHDVGDLDLYVWDPETNEPKVFDGQIVGSTGGTGVEAFEYTGPALVGVKGYQHASGAYTLTLTEK